MTELRDLTQNQLLVLINKATALLDHELYPQTHLWINGKHAEMHWWDDAK